MLYLFLVNSRDSTASNKLLSFRVRISQLCLEVLAIATVSGARTQSFKFILLGFVFPQQTGSEMQACVEEVYYCVLLNPKPLRK